MADDLNVIVVQREMDGAWDVSCFNEVCGHGLHDVGEDPSRARAEAMARRHRLQIQRETGRRQESAAPASVTIPREAFDGLVKVAQYVSMGRRYVGVEGPYPDATARMALGALHDAGALPDRSADA